MRREKKQNICKFVNSDQFMEPQDSFSYDKNNDNNKTFQENNISLNKLNYLSYDKKVKAFQNSNKNKNAQYLDNSKPNDKLY